ncbi:MAG: hypothetical protein EZS28_033693 [Streblomastix strix]|uniref:Uncharacterized protein n=1 Tax=Streblomastix strix TaxID=222440 RepID=A0A5J4UL17_9EUKA|nr:MAG: hypothetical protein EZS28_033693 [Streblomastix strix]
MKEGAQGAQQFDPGYNGVMSHAIQPLHAPILRCCDGTMTTDYSTGEIYANLDYITILLGTTDTKTIDAISIPRIWHEPRNPIISKFSVSRLFLTGPTFFRLQHITHKAQWNTQLFNLASKDRTLSNQINNKTSYRNQTTHNSTATATKLGRIAQDQQPLWNQQSTLGIDHSLFSQQQTLRNYRQI